MSLFDYIPSDDGFQATVVIRGVGFSEENTTLQVQVKNTTCYIVMSNQTKVVCVMERLPLGVHQLTLLVRPYGFALNASTGEGIFLRVEPRLVAIEPPRASEIGRSECQMSSEGMSAFCVLLFTTCFFSITFPLPRSLSDRRKRNTAGDTVCTTKYWGKFLAKMTSFLGCL